jgi:hypothetical protein
MTDRSPSPSLSPLAALLLGLLVAVGLAVGGWFVGHGLLEARSAERFVTVKGLSERQVPADLALWPLVFNASGDDLGALQAEMEDDAAVIMAFLRESGFSEDQWSLSAPRVTDYVAQGMAPSQRPGGRYTSEATVTLRTDRIDAVRDAISRSGELVRRGVTLIRSYEYQTQYLFTDLESVKPEMIAEATQDARRAAEQFAADSGSEVGAIRRASQGYFQVEDRDAFSPEVKNVRVVTTVEYFLQD